MRRFIFSETTIQQLKKKRYRSSFLMHAVIYLTMIWILFIGKTMDLGTTESIVFFIVIIGICLGVDFYTIRLFETVLRSQEYFVTESEIQKVVNGRVITEVRKDNIGGIQKLNGGVLITSIESRNNLFIPKGIENMDVLISDLRKTTGANNT
ncbi:hypothetical protein [Sabulibacter ruber]|uniref:hypothetical protein n=1 Tax=Sabulibacter ruber TaxID=2811901 RepID=UPI001A957E7A|nr:hypothetical protein [Sabulibacter ruber]